ncbi:MAG: exonuclease domain-containing protein [Lachnospiraceae bacterium]|nr:exonuclease domain-containing protein [Lachnospiraceae bacterium]
MKSIIVDFEMNPVDKKYEEEYDICSKEIIEVGAIKLDEDMNEISQFKCYFKPEYNTEIDYIINNITGISYDMVKNEKTFTEAVGDFVDWCAKDGEFRVYAWSNCDRAQFMKELTLKNIKITSEICAMMNNWEDFQRMFDIAVKACHSTSLENALKMVGLNFEGRAHDGMDDAINTARLFALFNDSEKFKPISNSLKEKHRLEAVELEENNNV